MFKSLMNLFPKQYKPLRTGNGPVTEFVDVAVSAFDGLNNHLSELLAKEAEAQANLNKARKALVEYRANLHLQYNNQLESLKELFGEDF